jgi:hypothetical protein
MLPFQSFQDLLNQYLSENDDFNGGLFMRYLAKNGFYGHVMEGVPMSAHYGISLVGLQLFR